MVQVGARILFCLLYQAMWSCADHPGGGCWLWWNEGQHREKVKNEALEPDSGV